MSRLSLDISSCNQIDQPIVSPKIIIDPFEYKNLALPVPIDETLLPSNDYEQIEQQSGQSKAQDQLIEPTPPITQDKSHSVDDLSRTSGDQTSSKSFLVILIFSNNLLISLST